MSAAMPVGLTGGAMFGAAVWQATAASSGSQKRIRRGGRCVMVDGKRSTAQARTGMVRRGRFPWPQYARRHAPGNRSPGRRVVRRGGSYPFPAPDRTATTVSVRLPRVAPRSTARAARAAAALICAGPSIVRHIR